MLFNLLKQVNPFKTIYYNLKWFPFPIGKKLPVFIAWNTAIYKSGGVILRGNIHTAMIKIGFPLGGFRNRNDSTMIDFRGNAIFKGHCSLGKGSKVIVDRDGTIVFGNNFNCTAGLNLECKKSIRFGNDCVLSWDITILDTDFHPIIDDLSNILNPNNPVVIGNNVWIGYNTKIMKGITIADNVVIASNTVVTKSINDSCSVVANEGLKMKTLRKKVSWQPTDIK